MSSNFLIQSYSSSHNTYLAVIGVFYLKGPNLVKLWDINYVQKGIEKTIILISV